MNPSAYAALMKAMQDETEGVAHDPTRVAMYQNEMEPQDPPPERLAAFTPPPINTSSDVKEPAPETLDALGVVAPPAPAKDMDPGFSVPGFSIPGPNKDMDPGFSIPSQGFVGALRGGDTKSSFGVPDLQMDPELANDIVKRNVMKPPAADPKARSKADLYDVGFGETRPLPRTTTSAAEGLASGIGRAGAQLSAAIAGVKPDTGYFDAKDKDAAARNTAQDASNDEFTKFKQALFLKDAESRKAKADKDNPDLRDPNSVAFRQKTALIRSTDIGRMALGKYLANAAASGVSPDLNDWDAKLSGLISGQNSVDNNIRTGDRITKENEKGRDFKRENEQIAFDLSNAHAKYMNDLKAATDAREAFHPNRVLTNPDRAPDITTARHQREADADSQYILGQIDRLRELIQQNGPDVARVIPGFNGQVQSLTQAIDAAMLHARGYGVPTGKDWEMVKRETGDPTHFIDLVTHNQDAKIQEAATSIRRLTDQKASDNGYGPYLEGSGGAQPKMEAPVPHVTVPKRGTALGMGTSAPQKAGGGGNDIPTVDADGNPVGETAPTPVANGMKTPWGVPFATMKERVVNGKKQFQYRDAAGNILKPPAGQ